MDYGTIKYALRLDVNWFHRITVFVVSFLLPEGPGIPRGWSRVHPLRSPRSGLTHVTTMKKPLFCLFLFVRNTTVSLLGPTSELPFSVVEKLPHILVWLCVVIMSENYTNISCNLQWCKPCLFWRKTTSDNSNFSRCSYRWATGALALDRNKRS